MNKFEFSISGINQSIKIIKFINQNWKKNHILTKNKKLLDWQYRNINGYNFVLASDQNFEFINGILGFIEPKRYSKKYTSGLYWLALWAVKKSSRPGLGVGLIKYLIKRFNVKIISTVGLSSDAIQIYKALKYNVGKMDHFFILNDCLDKFSILKINKKFKKIKNIPNKKTIDLIEIQKNEIKDNRKKLNACRTNIFPVKDFEYINKKYLKHPFYSYRLFVTYEIDKPAKPTSIIIMRVINVKKSSILRIIDFLGDKKVLLKLEKEFKKVLYREGHEYIDLLVHGMDKNKMQTSGYRIVNNNNFIVPNLFEPFKKININVHFAYKFFDKNIKNRKFFIFKGDGDKERPNLI